MRVSEARTADRQQMSYVDVGVVELGKKNSCSSVLHSLYPLKIGVWQTVRNTESCSNLAAIQWWHKQRSVRHQEAKSSKAAAKPGDGNYNPDCRCNLSVYSITDESSVTLRTFRWSDIFVLAPATAK